MRSLKIVIGWGTALMLVLLTALAGVVYSRIKALSLPIPGSLALLTVLLPLCTATTGSFTFVLPSAESRRIKKGRPEPTLSLLVFCGLITLQVIYETVIATLALTYVAPPSSLLCGLERQWEKLYKNKDQSAIKTIQDSLNCCGFNSVKDRAWPFGKSQPSDCSDRFDRQTSCAGVWRQAQQTNAGLLFLVAAAIFSVKALVFVYLLYRGRRIETPLIIDDTGDDAPRDSHGEVRRLIEDGGATAPYSDDVGEDSHSRTIEPPPSNGHLDTTSRIQSSQLVNHGNEWRD